MIHIQIIAVLPEIFEALNYGMPYWAQQKGKISIELLNLRDFSEKKHRRIDDRPYGGGPGMVIQVSPLAKAIKTALKKTPTDTLISYVSPYGKIFNQKNAYQLSQRNHLIFVAGRYEGLDERIYSMYPHEHWSLGDFILSGGEPAVVCIIDAISRLIPGVLGNEQSAEQESFNTDDTLLEYPHYTRPACISDLEVPTVLLSGNHQKIVTWRRKTSLQRTQQHRPDLLQNANLTEQDKKMLSALNED